MNKRQLLRATALSIAALGLAGHATAQDFPPKKTVTLVVGFAAGGAADAAARLIAKKLGENIGQTVVVDNQAGAGGNIAHQQVASGPTDGSMLLFGSIGPLTIAPHVMKVPYDPFKDLAAVTGGVNFPNVLVVHKGLGVKTLAEFVALAKKKPGSVDFASTGAGSASHLAGELFNQRAGIDMVHVPVQGRRAGPAGPAGRAHRLVLLGAADGAAAHRGRQADPAGDHRPRRRPAYMPNIPTVAESGYPGFEALNWYAFVAPGKTPAPILERWNQEIVKVLDDPDVKDALNKHGLTPQPTTRAELTEFMKKEDAKWGAIVRERKITAN